ncbi:helix-turn-helix domain-containing protein [Streptomyces triticirhizae]|uniref:XRE family transcriptional regulator n=1 Tax=Streptomyces triticirhizae TaxID=2483353 RepID=A0A3M2KZD9_9ACTN|nr:helix-turn-helix transcriptional regulator [Streptomyces triticirhizae]RMI30016.1 XRE family transcriptional regulator [Streptomyces triticirhizae]
MAASHDEGAPEVMNDLEYLGAEIKEARLRAGLSQRQFASGTGFTQSYISKVERGALIPSRKFAQKCDLVLGADGRFERQRERLVKRGHPSWFAPFAKMEAEARAIMVWSVWILPGLLHTEDYARALFRAGNPDVSDEWIEKKVANRMARRGLLTRENPPKFWAIINEASLLSHIGGVRVMRAQLEHLAEAARMPKITLQVLSRTAEAPPATEPFILLEMPQQRTVAYTDTALGGQMATSDDQVEFCRSAFERLRAEALSPTKSIRLIEKIAKELPNEDV